MESSKRLSIPISDLLNPSTSDALHSTPAYTTSAAPQQTGFGEEENHRTIPQETAETALSPEEEDDDDDDDDGYSTEYEAQALFILWKVRRHVALKYNKPSHHRPLPRETRYTGPEDMSSASAPREVSSSPDQYERRPRNQQLRGVDTAQEQAPTARAIRAANKDYRKATERLEESEKEATKLRKERRMLGLARNAVGDLKRIDQKLENVRRMAAVSGATTFQTTEEPKS